MHSAMTVAIGDWWAFPLDAHSPSTFKKEDDMRKSKGWALWRVGDALPKIKKGRKKHPLDAPDFVKIKRDEFIKKYGFRK